MSSDNAGCRLVILGISSVLRLTHREAGIPAKLSEIMAEAVNAYWENGSMAGFCNAVGERISKLVEKSDWVTEPLLISEPESTSRYNAFLVALYQEIFAFCEFAQLRTTLYLAHAQAAGESVNVVFTTVPCTVSFVAEGPDRGDMILTPTRKEEDE